MAEADHTMQRIRRTTKKVLQKVAERERRSAPQLLDVMVEERLELHPTLKQELTKDDA